VARLGILSVPAVLLFRGGTVGYQFIGELSRHELDELLARVCIGHRATAEPAIRHSAAQLPTKL
jgi:thioredoxin-like negative regulator of GroEL